MLLVYEIQLRQQARDSSAHIAQAVEPGHEAEMLFNGEIVEQVGLVRNESERPLRGHRLGPEVMAGDFNPAACGYDDSSDAADGGRLPRAVGTDQAQHLAGSHRKAEPLDSGEVPVKFVQAIHLDHGYPAQEPGETFTIRATSHYETYHPKRRGRRNLCETTGCELLSVRWPSSSSGWLASLWLSRAWVGFVTWSTAPALSVSPWHSSHST